MDVESQLLDIERKLWTNDAVFYKHSLTEDAVLVFAETGPITRAVAIEAIHAENAEGRRWAEVDIGEVRLARLTTAACLLTYTVAARKESERSGMSALASSVYVHRSGAWKLAFHQQTPLKSVTSDG
jgi:uncharacterized protein (TIGR02246 family)